MPKANLLYPTIRERIAELRRLRAEAQAKGTAQHRAAARMRWRNACEEHAPWLMEFIERRLDGGVE